MAPVLIGMNKEGVVRADFKTKEVDNDIYNEKYVVQHYIVFWNQILDVWPYQVLKNWGYTEHTFVLEFDDRTYPVKTSQGRWMNAMVDFYIETILGDMVRIL